MKVNVNKTKITVFEKEESMTVCNIVIDGKVEQVNDFVYLNNIRIKEE
jgi:hypothetical protein